VRATVNPNRTVLELNYKNNTLTKELSAPKSDLIVRSLRCIYWENFPGCYLGFVIANIGRAISPDWIHAVVSIGDQLLNISGQGNIPGGNEMLFQTDMPIVKGAEYRVTVDPHNLIDEEREDNNSLTAIPLP
jgi:hypothetical protein